MLESTLKGWFNMKENIKGLLLCILIALPAWIIGRNFPVVGGPVISIVLGMIVTQFIKDKSSYSNGIKFASKKILQWAVILLGFGLNLSVVISTGKQSLPIIIVTISTSLLIAFLLQKFMKVDKKISTLVGIGSSVCGGSAIAAAAPVIDADDEEVAQAIAVIFFFNVIAAILFPQLGALLGFSGNSGEAFGIFAGTAINDTSSVTAAASTWDSVNHLGSATLDKAVTVKLTRTLAIIPITLVLGFSRLRRERKNDVASKEISWKKVFPTFIIYFILASVFTTVLTSFFGLDISIFTPVKELSKFFIIIAMAAIGLNTNLIKLIKTGGKPIIMGFCCWIGITLTSLLMQSLMGIW